MKIGEQILLITLLVTLNLSVTAQDTTHFHQSFRLEGGLGFGMASEGIGTAGRAALSFTRANWGAVLRLAACSGEEGVKTADDWFGPPVENFYENALLISRVIKQGRPIQLIASCGIGRFSGKKLDYTKRDLINIDNTVGFAYELAMATTGTFVGLSLGIMGNVNSDTNLFAFIISITFGGGK